MQSVYVLLDILLYLRVVVVPVFIQVEMLKDMVLYTNTTWAVMQLVVFSIWLFFFLKIWRSL